MALPLRRFEGPIEVRRTDDGITVNSALPVTPLRQGLHSEYCRAVYAIGANLILKADIHPEREWYTRQTKAELRFYLRRLLSDDARYFPKLVAYGTYRWQGRTFWWLLQERVQCDTTPRFTPVPALKTVVKLARRYGIGDLDLSFGPYCVGRNWALRPDNTPVIWDFGVEI